MVVVCCPSSFPSFLRPPSTLFRSQPPTGPPHPGSQSLPHVAAEAGRRNMSRDAGPAGGELRPKGRPPWGVDAQRLTHEAGAPALRDPQTCVPRARRAGPHIGGRWLCHPLAVGRPSICSHRRSLHLHGYQVDRPRRFEPMWPQRSRLLPQESSQMEQ